MFPAIHVNKCYRSALSSTCLYSSFTFISSSVTTFPSNFVLLQLFLIAIEKKRMTMTHHDPQFCMHRTGSGEYRLIDECNKQQEKSQSWRFVQMIHFGKEKKNTKHFAFLQHQSNGILKDGELTLAISWMATFYGRSFIQNSHSIFIQLNFTLKRTFFNTS